MSLGARESSVGEALDMQAGRPELELQSPQEKASVLVCACKPSGEEAEKEWSLGLTDRTV